MDQYGNRTLRDLYPITCQVCHNLIAGAVYDANGSLESPTQPAKVVGFQIQADGIPVNLYAHWECLRLEPVSRHVFSLPPVLRDDYGTCFYCGATSRERFCSERCAKMHDRDKADAIQESLNPAVAALIENLKQIRQADQAELRRKAQELSRDASNGNGYQYSGTQRRIMVDGSSVSQIEHQARLNDVIADDLGVFVPQNEMGVVFLLGGVIDRIGYRMAYIDGRYPDAVLVGPDKSKVKTELEFNASSFIAHGHNPDLCDLVICWNQDTKLGLPVIELKRYYDTKTGEWNFRNLS